MEKKGNGEGEGGDVGEGIHGRQRDVRVRWAELICQVLEEGNCRSRENWG